MKFKSLTLVVLSTLLPPLANAGLITSGAAGIESIDNTNSGSPAWHVDNGQTGTSSGGRFGLMTFQLPDLGGQSITDSDLTIHFVEGSSTVSGDFADVWVYNSFSDDALLDGTGNGSAADFAFPFAGVGSDTSDSDYTLIQRGFFDDSTTGDSLVSLNSTGKSNLTSFLQSNYTAGEYLVVGFVYDDESGGTGFGDRYFFGVEDAPSNGRDVFFAGQQLSITAVPEPSSILLLTAVLGTLLSLRRRRR